VAEKPDECAGQCRRPATVVYQEIIRDVITCTEMCSECPVLQARLYGTSSLASGKQIIEKEAGVCCGRCGTTLLSVRTGGLVGCSECYNVFNDTLIQELVSERKVPNRMQKMKENTKKQGFHTGKTPDKAVELTSMNQIVGLNEALKEALKKENYEQAAWLRDQIKVLTEKGRHEGAS
jgi:protein arginine kinase activator